MNDAMTKEIREESKVFNKEKRAHTEANDKMKDCKVNKWINEQTENK